MTTTTDQLDTLARLRDKVRQNVDYDRGDWKDWHAQARAVVADALTGWSVRDLRALGHAAKVTGRSADQLTGRLAEHLRWEAMPRLCDPCGGTGPSSSSRTR